MMPLNDRSKATPFSTFTMLSAVGNWTLAVAASILIIHVQCSLFDNVVQTNYVDEEQTPLTIYFEQDHYRNKASEEGFCQQTCASEPSSLIYKPGECPAPTAARQQRLNCVAERPPRHQCRYDSECPRRQRCCLVGEGPCAHRQCVDPVFRVTCSDLQCDGSSACVDRPAMRMAGQDARCVSTIQRQGQCTVLDERRPSRPTSGHQCEDLCDHDEECSDAEHKCCQTSCGRRCVRADRRVTCQQLTCSDNEQCVEYPPQDARCVDVTPREGLCPKVDTNQGHYPGTCKNQCYFDSECGDDQKCCYNGCGTKCLRRRRPDCDTIKCKVGYKCQLDFDGQPQCNPIPCRQDGEVVDIECNSCTCIQGFLLCSQEECPPVKPGFCPRLVRGYRGQCSESCSSDYDCSGDDKCCSTGCGRACKQPTLSIVHPCKTVRFRCGDDTHCAATRGLCQPGRPCPLVPLCVSRSAPFCESCPEGKVCILQKRPCPHGHCERQPICVQLYSDDTPFRHDQELEQNVIARQTRHISN